MNYSSLEAIPQRYRPVSLDKWLKEQIPETFSHLCDVCVNARHENAKNDVTQRIRHDESE